MSLIKIEENDAPSDSVLRAASAARVTTTRWKREWRRGFRGVTAKASLFLAPSVAVAALFVAPAHAQNSDPAAARGLFAEARQLATQRKYDQACPKFEESLRLDYGVGTLFNLADCWEHLGRTASAWARFLDAAAGARAAGQADRERVARERAAALEPKLSRLTIEVKKADVGLDIKRDGVSIGRAAWGTPVPIDPGAYVLEASAPGKKSSKTNVEIPARPGTVVVGIAPLEDKPEPVQANAPNANPPTDAVRAQPGPLSTGESSDAIEGAWNAQKTVGVSLAGVGVAGLVVGTVFALRAKSKNDSALAICSDHPNACSNDEMQQHGSLVDEAKSARTAAYVGFGVGGAALIGGVALYFSAPQSHTAIAVHPFVSGSTVGAALATTW